MLPLIFYHITTTPQNFPYTIFPRKSLFFTNTPIYIDR